MIVSKYIRRQIFNVTLFASLFLCSAIVLLQSIRFVDLIVNRGISLIEFGYLSSLMVPRFIALVMPIALFGATVFVFQRMIQDSEFVVLRSSGMSTFQLAKPAIVLSVLASVVCYSMTVYVMPLAAQELRENLTEKRSKFGSALLQEGKFTSIGEGATIFVRKREGDELLGLLYHVDDGTQPATTILSNRGVILDSPEGPRIVIYDGSRQVFDGGRLHFVEFDQTSVAITIQSEVEEYHWAQPEERYLPRLFFPDQTKGDQFYKTNLIAEGHHRLVLPLLPITYTLVGLAFVLRTKFSRRGRGEALFFSFIIVLGILLSHLWSKSAAGKDSSMVVVMYGTALVPALISLLLISRPSTGGLSGRSSRQGRDAPNSGVAVEA